MCNHNWMTFGVDKNENYRICSRCGKKKYIITNEDRIRFMSEDELAHFLKCCMFNDFKPPCKKSGFFTAEKRPDCDENCAECIKGWLKKTAEEE